MSVLAEAKQALLDLHSLTKGLKDGRTPDAASVLGHQAELVRLHALLGEDMAARFGGKERAYLARKIAQAKEHANGRVNLKLTSKDAEEAALLAVGEEFNNEIDVMETYELYRIMMKSLQNGIDFARSVASFVKTSESNV